MRAGAVAARWRRPSVVACAVIRVVTSSLMVVLLWMRGWWPGRRWRAAAGRGAGRGGLAAAGRAGGGFLQVSGQALPFAAFSGGVGLGPVQALPQFGDGVAERVELCLAGGGQSGGVPVVVVAEPGGLVAGILGACGGGCRSAQRGVAFGVGGCDRGLGLGPGLAGLVAGGLGGGAGGVAGLPGLGLRVPGGLGAGLGCLGGFHRGDGLGGGCAGLGSGLAGGVGERDLAGQLGAGGFRAGGGLGADRLDLGLGG